MKLEMKTYRRDDLEVGQTAIVESEDFRGMVVMKTDAARPMVCLYDAYPWSIGRSYSLCNATFRPTEFTLKGN